MHKFAFVYSTKGVRYILYIIYIYSEYQYSQQHKQQLCPFRNAGQGFLVYKPESKVPHFPFNMFAHIDKFFINIQGVAAKY